MSKNRIVAGLWLGQDCYVCGWGDNYCDTAHTVCANLTKIILQSVSLWKEQSGHNTCSSVRERVIEGISSLYWELNTVTVTQVTVNTISRNSTSVQNLQFVMGTEQSNSHTIHCKYNQSTQYLSSRPSVFNGN
jgi:hypothetical protein